MSEEEYVPEDVESSMERYEQLLLDAAQYHPRMVFDKLSLIAKYREHIDAQMILETAAYNIDDVGFIATHMPRVEEMLGTAIAQSALEAFALNANEDALYALMKNPQGLVAIQLDDARAFHEHVRNILMTSSRMMNMMLREPDALVRMLGDEAHVFFDQMLDDVIAHKSINELLRYADEIMQYCPLFSSKLQRKIAAHIDQEEIININLVTVQNVLGSDALKEIVMHLPLHKLINNIGVVFVRNIHPDVKAVLRVKIEQALESGSDNFSSEAHVVAERLLLGIRQIGHVLGDSYAKRIITYAMTHAPEAFVQREAVPHEEVMRKLDWMAYVEDEKTQMDTVFDMLQTADDSATRERIAVAIARNNEALLQECPHHHDVIVQAMSAHIAQCAYDDISNDTLAENERMQLIQRYIDDRVSREAYSELFDDMLLHPDLCLILPDEVRTAVSKNVDIDNLHSAVRFMGPVFGYVAREYFTQEERVEMMRVVAARDPKIVRRFLKEYDNIGMDDAHMYEVGYAIKEYENIIQHDSFDMPQRTIRQKHIMLSRNAWRAIFANINAIVRKNTNRPSENLQGHDLITTNQQRFEKVFFSDAFRSVIEQHVDTDTPWMRMFSLAQAIERRLQIQDMELTDENIATVAQELLHLKEKTDTRELLGPHTKVILFTHKEKRFKNDAIYAMLRRAGVPEKNIIVNVKGTLIKNGKNVQKQAVLDALRDSRLQGQDVTVLFSGHGFAENWFFDNNKRPDNVDHDASYKLPRSINYDEMAQALIDGGNITRTNMIGLACYAYDYLQNMSSTLKECDIAQRPYVSISTANKSVAGFGFGNANRPQSDVDSMLLNALYESVPPGQPILLKDVYKAEAALWKFQDAGIMLGQQVLDDEDVSSSAVREIPDNGAVPHAPHKLQKELIEVGERGSDVFSDKQRDVA